MCVIDMVNDDFSSANGLFQLLSQKPFKNGNGKRICNRCYNGKRP